MVESSKPRLTLGFCDREWIEEYNGFWDASRVISITDPQSEPAKIKMDEKFICRLSFHDLEPRHLNLLSESEQAKIVLYTEAMAETVVSFVKQQLGNGMQALMIHCEAGVSRSPAMAEAFKEVLTPLHDIIWFPRRCAPNAHVRTLTLSAWRLQLYREMTQ